MKEFLAYAALFLMLIIALPVNAQMMGVLRTDSATGTTSVQKDEAEGKAVWDKLQNKEVTCKDLSDDDFDVLGDFFMGNMMGANHDAMNTMMSERLGDNGEKQLHISMGKRLSGCDTSAAFPKGSDYFAPMMGTGQRTIDADMSGRDADWGEGGGYGRGNMMSYGSHNFIGGIMSLGSLIFLILGSIFFWKGIKQRD